MYTRRLYKLTGGLVKSQRVGEVLVVEYTQNFPRASSQLAGGVWKLEEINATRRLCTSNCEYLHVAILHASTFFRVFLQTANKKY